MWEWGWKAQNTSWLNIQEHLHHGNGPMLQIRVHPSRERAHPHITAHTAGGVGCAVHSGYTPAVPDSSGHALKGTTGSVQHPCENKWWNNRPPVYFGSISISARQLPGGINSRMNGEGTCSLSSWRFRDPTLPPGTGPLCLFLHFHLEGITYVF